MASSIFSPKERKTTENPMSIRNVSKSEECKNTFDIIRNIWRTHQQAINSLTTAPPLRTYAATAAKRKGFAAHTHTQSRSVHENMKKEAGG